MEKCEEGEFNGGLGMTTPLFYRKCFFIQHVNFHKVNQIIPLMMKKNGRVFKNIFIFLN